MTDLETYLKELEELSAKATPGPWMSNKDFYANEKSYIDAKDHAHMAHIRKDSDYKNSDFIAESRAAIPLLLKLVREYREVLELIHKKTDEEFKYFPAVEIALAYDPREEKSVSFDDDVCG